MYGYDVAVHWVGGRGLWRMLVGTMLTMAFMASSSRSRAAVVSVIDADIPGEMSLAVAGPRSLAHWPRFWVGLR